MTLGAAVLANDFELFDKKFEFINRYADNEGHRHEKFRNIVEEGRVLDCVRALAMSSFAKYPSLRVQVSPSKGALCEHGHREGPDVIGPMHQERQRPRPGCWRGVRRQSGGPDGRECT